jgi:SAM-dependent methyltransferase
VVQPAIETGGSDETGRRLALAKAPALDGAVDHALPQEALEHTACPTCGVGGATLLLYGRDRLFGKQGWYPVVRCTSCSTQYINPRPSEDALRAHYPADYLPVRPPEATPPLVRWLARAAISARWSAYLGMVEEVVGTIPAGAQVVDVGCGLNDLLVRLERRRGCRGIGVDISPEVVAYIRDRLAMPVAHGTLLSAKLEPNRFDLVTMNQYLEHEPEPLAMLREARRISKKGAHIVVEVPYSSGLPARVFGSCWSQLDVPRHLVFYTPETLRDILARSGYRLVHIRTFGAPFSIGLSVLQSLGFTRLGRLTALDVCLATLVGLPLLPFFPLLKEFMLAVAVAE